MIRPYPLHAVVLSNSRRWWPRPHRLFFHKIEPSTWHGQPRMAPPVRPSSRSISSPSLLEAPAPRRGLPFGDGLPVRHPSLTRIHVAAIPPSWCGSISPSNGTRLPPPAGPSGPPRLKYDQRAVPLPPRKTNASPPSNEAPAPRRGLPFSGSPAAQLPPTKTLQGIHVAAMPPSWSMPTLPSTANRSVPPGRRAAPSTLPAGMRTTSPLSQGPSPPSSTGSRFPGGSRCFVGLATRPAPRQRPGSTPTLPGLQRAIK